MHSQGTWLHVCVLVDLHHYTNPHELIMISVMYMYTTCSYHGDQPLGEYLSCFISLIPRHSDCRRNECLMAAGHLHISYFFQKSDKQCFWYFNVHGITDGMCMWPMVAVLWLLKTSIEHHNSYCTARVS